MSDELKPHVSILELREAMEIGRDRERERIIKLLHDNIGWCEALEYEAFADQLEELIKGEQNG
jgi:hypothetical protein